MESLNSLTQTSGCSLKVYLGVLELTEVVLKVSFDKLQHTEPEPHHLLTGRFCCFITKLKYIKLRIYILLAEAPVSGEPHTIITPSTKLDKNRSPGNHQTQTGPDGEGESSHCLTACIELDAAGHHGNPSHEAPLSLRGP